jgi:hemoglobin-like flavoprotein
MDKERAHLVRDIWMVITPRADEIAAAFYAHLFALDPGAREMFAHVDMTAQGRKFLAMIGTLIRLLDDPADIVIETIPAARRHATYGVTGGHLDVGREALMRTLEDTLRDEFTPSARQAWAELYDLAAAVMRRASRATAPT